MAASNRLVLQGFIDLHAHPSLEPSYKGETKGRVAALLKTGGRSRALTIVRTELGRAYSLAGQHRLGNSGGRAPK